MNVWKNNCALPKADTPRLRSRTRNICSVFSISAVSLKLMVKIIQVLKNSMAWHFLTFKSLTTELKFVYPPWYCGWAEEQINAHLLVKFNNPQVNHLLIWKISPCLKFGKTSNRAVENLPQRKLWVWARTMHVLIRIWSHRTSASACFFGNDRSSHSRVRTRLIKSVYFKWASDSFTYPCPCNNSWYARTSPRVKNIDQTRHIWKYGLTGVMRAPGFDSAFL